MKNLTLILALTLTCLQCIFAQVHQGRLIIDSQSQIDAFNFTSVNGNVFIREDGSGAITNLDGLSTLTSVSGTLSISNTSIQNVNGLSNLISTGSLRIDDNASLSSVEGLTLITTTDSFFLQRNNMLTNINGLNIETINGRLFVNQNPALVNIDGLSKLNTVGSDIFIEKNIMLNNLDGLSNVRSVGFDGFQITDVTISQNSMLVNACGIIYLLENPEAVDAGISIYGNGPNTSSTQDIIDNCNNSCTIFEGDLILTSQTEIDNFKYCEITGNLIIREATPGAITDTAPIAKLTKLGGDLRVIRNLSIINIKGLVGLKKINGTLEIKGNKGLKNLSGLRFVTQMNSNILLINNPVLSNINGLSKLTKVQGNLNIQGNGLRKLGALVKLQKIQGNLILKNNGLRNLDGLKNVLSVTNNVRVTGNEFLENACGIVGLLANTSTVGGTITILDNGPNTSNTQEIIDSCKDIIPPFGGGDAVGKSNATSLQVFPTVSNGNSITVSGATAIFRYSIATLSGTILEQKQIQNTGDTQKIIFNNPLPKGTYIITIQQKGGSNNTISRKFFVQ